MTVYIVLISYPESVNNPAITEIAEVFAKEEDAIKLIAEHSWSKGKYTCVSKKVV